jgi:leader peptidase (prepilin peptidase)/N-methyltransferase
LSYIALAIAILTVISKSAHLTDFIDVILAVLIDGGIFYGLFQVSQGKWIGGGDVRLGFVLGLVMATPGRAILLLFLASALGTLVSLPLMATKRLKKSSLVPFGPFLIAAAIIVELLGHFLLAWYQNTFLPNGV